MQNTFKVTLVRFPQMLKSPEIKFWNNPTTKHSFQNYFNWKYLPPPMYENTNSVKTSIFDKELGSNILFLQYTNGSYFWRKTILVDRSDCVIWCISKVYLRWLRSQWAWKQFLKMLQFRALGYILKKKKKNVWFRYEVGTITAPCFPARSHWGYDVGWIWGSNTLPFPASVSLPLCLIFYIQSHSLFPYP